MSNDRFASRMQGMSGNVIREILKLTQASDVISFAGGLPSPESFPVDTLRQIANECLSGDLSTLLQYSTSEGYPPLREFLASWVKRTGIQASPEDVLILTGSQQGIDLACKAILDPGDTVLVEEPTYLAALQIFQLYQAKVVPVRGDASGMDMEALDEAIREHRPKLIYVIPTFRNPSGETWSCERREQLALRAGNAGVYVIEDDPYGALRYEGERLPSVKSFDTEGRVVYLGSFSKVISPGLRVGFAVAARGLLRNMVIGKQATDVHTSNLSQQLVYEFSARGHLDPHLERICAIYKEKRDVMLQAIEQSFPDGATWTRPEGGLFIWVRLKGGNSTEKLLPVAVEQERVAFIPGTPFFADGSGADTMRLNFSNASIANIEEGIARLGRILARAMANV